MKNKYSLNDQIVHHSRKYKKAKSPKDRSYSEGYLAGVGIKSYSFKKDLNDDDYAAGYSVACQQMKLLYELKAFGKGRKK